MTPLLILAAAAAGPATAAPAPDLEEVIVACSRLEIPLTDIGANVTVLTRENFDVEKPVQLADLLRGAAGVHVDQVGGRGGTGSLYLRGADPNYTLVLVNGVRVNDPTNARGGSFDFSAFDVDDIERVEIARGPYSAVYGGDALAGVINIVTRRQDGDALNGSIDAMTGAHDTREVAVRGGGTLGGGAWNLGFSDSNEGEVIRGNNFESQRVSGRFDQWFGQTRMQLSGRYAESERAGFPDDSGGYEFAALRDTERRDAHEATFGAGFTRYLGNGSVALNLGYFDRGDRIDSPGIAPGVRDPFGVPASFVDSSISRFTGTFTGTHGFSDWLEVAYGAEYQREDGDSDGDLDFGGGFVLPTSFDLTRTSFAPFAEARVDAGAFSVQAGLRVDKPEDYSSVTSPRVRVAYQVDTGDSSALTIAGSWGKAFKLPSLYALGHPLVGNPDLAPERGESHEIQVSQYLNDETHWSVTWFESAYRNAIDFDPGPPPMLVNRNRVDTHGFEVSGDVTLADATWRLDASVTQAKSRVASTGGELRNRPEWRASAGAHWTPVSELRLSATATYVGSSFDSSIATGDIDLSPYTRVDVSAVWEVTPRLETYLAIDNLTDEKYEQFVGFESRGIAPRLGVKFSL